AVDHAYLLEDAVMVQPHHADHREADEVREVIRPLLPQRMREALVLRYLWRPQLEDEQRDDDREHAVRERFDTILRHGGRLGRSARQQDRMGTLRTWCSPDGRRPRS